MARETSIEAYNQIKAGRLLGELQMAVYAVLFERGPLSTSEIAQLLPQYTHRSITPRLTELRDRGAVKETGTKICSVTNRKVIAWDVTARLPSNERVTRISRKELEKRLKWYEGKFGPYTGDQA